MPKPLYEPVLELTRGPVVESIHFGSIVVAAGDGRLVAWYGNPTAVTYLRSSSKPFQALPFIENGGQQAYQLSLQEIALICASHAGTDQHLAVVQGLQKKTGVRESDLLCGTHPLSHPATVEAMRRRGEQVTPNRHNCSGKHTGMLAYIMLKKLRGVEITGEIPYTDVDHPIQQEILAAFAEMCGLDPGQVAIGIDGCSVPNFAVPLCNAASAYARLCDPAGLSPTRAAACRTITMAMTSHPLMVGGPDSFDTALMEVTRGRVVCKGGAEGYQALGIMPGASGPASPALGITLKVSDGGQRGSARPAVAVEVLRQLGILSSVELEALSRYGPVFQLHNWRAIEVGEGRPCFRLNYGSG